MFLLYFYPVYHLDVEKIQFFFDLPRYLSDQFLLNTNTEATVKSSCNCSTYHNMVKERCVRNQYRRDSHRNFQGWAGDICKVCLGTRWESNELFVTRVVQQCSRIDINDQSRYIIQSSSCANPIYSENIRSQKGCTIPNDIIRAIWGSPVTTFSSSASSSSHHYWG